MKVECTFKHMNFLFSTSKSQAGYTCRVTSIKELNINSIELIGKHDEGLTNRDVVGVSIQGLAELKKLPKGFGNIFPNLKYMKVIRCSIRNLKAEDFEGLSSLQGLWLNENFISALPNGLFENVQGLKYLSFHKNHLRFIGANLLAPLKNLKQAYFTENTCIDASYCENSDELRSLNEEIASKCCFPVLASNNNSSYDANIIKDLITRFGYIEDKYKKLESENKQKDLKINALEGRMTTMKTEIEDLKGKLEMFF